MCFNLAYAMLEMYTVSMKFKVVHIQFLSSLSSFFCTIFLILLGYIYFFCQTISFYLLFWRGQALFVCSQFVFTKAFLFFFFIKYCPCSPLWINGPSVIFIFFPLTMKHGMGPISCQTPIRLFLSDSAYKHTVYACLLTMDTAGHIIKV